MFSKMFAKTATAILILQFLLVATQAGVSSIAFDMQPKNATNGTQNQRPNNTYVIQYTNQMIQFCNTYDPQVDTIASQAVPLLSKLNATDKQLNALEASNALDKSCVVQYRGKLYTFLEVRGDFGKCVVAAKDALKTALDAPTKTMVAIQNYYDNVADPAFEKCNLNTNVTQSINCLQEAVTAAYTFSVTNEATFDTQMLQAYVSGETIIKATVQCTFNVIDKALYSVYNTLSLVNMCTKNNNA